MRSNLTTADRRHHAATSAACWSCGASTTRPDGLCGPCGQIDGSAVPDMTDPTWKGYTGHGLATSDVMVAPPNARNITPRA